MSHTQHNQKYDSSDVEDQEVGEICMQQDQDQDNFDDETNYDDNFDSDDETMPQTTEQVVPDWDQSDDEAIIMPAAAPQATEEEMQDAYKEFIQLCKADEEAKHNEELSAQYDELVAWCKSAGISMESMPGNFAQKFEEMRLQKAFELKALAEERKITEEKERLERIAKGDAERKAMLEASIKAGRDRAKAKQCSANAKGKLQGDKTGVGKRARKAAEKVAEAKKVAAKVAMVAPVAKLVVVKQIALTQNTNTKSKSKGLTVESTVAPDVEAEEVESYIISTKEQHLEHETKQVVKPVVAKKEVDDGFTTVVAKKPRKMDTKLTAAEVSQCLFTQAKPASPTHSVKSSNPMEAARQAGFAMLANASTQQSTLTYTRMCTSVGSGKTCPHGSKCRFAHSFEQLNKKRCAFSNIEGHACRYAIATGKGTYKNKPGQTTGKICQCWHQDETEASYAARMGIKIQPAKRVPVAEPVKIQLKPTEAKPVVEAPVKLAPWAVAKPEPRKSRWDAKPVEVPKTPVTKTVEVPKTPVTNTVEVPKTVEVTPRKSRFSPIAPPTTPQVVTIAHANTIVIRVPKCMQQAALEMCINKGMANFQIVLTDA